MKTKKHTGGRPKLPQDKKRINVAFSLPPDCVRRLKESAEKRKWTKSFMLELIIDDFCTQEKLMRKSR